MVLMKFSKKERKKGSVINSFKKKKKTDLFDAATSSNLEYSSYFISSIVYIFTWLKQSLLLLLV